MIEKIPLHLIDSDTQHEPDFIFSVPKPGHGRALAMLFRSEALIDTAEGRKDVRPGDFILHTPNFPLWHASVPGASEGFRNDWFYTSPETILPVAEKIKIPFNTLIPTGKKNLIEPFIQSLRESMLRNDSFSERSIYPILENMLIAVARAEKDYRLLHRVLSTKERLNYERMLSVRDFLRDRFSEPFDSESLAKKCALSVERFTSLYKYFFGVTPFGELMRARNLHAQKMLVGTSLSISEIAFACGWSDHRYFDRVFRKMNGVTPGIFRKSSGFV